MSHPPEVAAPAWLPPRVGRLPASSAYLPLPAAAPVPPAPPRRPKAPRGILLAGVGCLLVALALGMLTVIQYRDSHSAQAAVRRYFTALAAGNAAAALGAAAQPPHGAYLTDSVLRQQLRIAKLTDLTVQESSLDGGSGTVLVRYRLRFATGTEQVTDSVPVLRRGSSWRLRTVAVATDVAITSSGTDRLTLAGGKLPSQPVLLFPGALPLATDNPAVQVDGRPMLRLSDDPHSAAVTVSLTAAAQARLRRSVDQALARCLAVATARPNCPPAGDNRSVPGSLHGTALPLSQPLVVSLSTGGEVDAVGAVTVRGSWLDWDFNNQPVRHTGDTQLALSARASVADLDTIYWSGQ